MDFVVIIEIIRTQRRERIVEVEKMENKSYVRYQVGIKIYKRWKFLYVVAVS
jgi:hypothetical protein